MHISSLGMGSSLVPLPPSPRCPRSRPPPVDNHNHDHNNSVTTKVCWWWTTTRWVGCWLNKKRLVVVGHFSQGLLVRTAGGWSVMGELTKQELFGWLATVLFSWQEIGWRSINHCRIWMIDHGGELKPVCCYMFYECSLLYKGSRMVGVSCGYMLHVLWI